MATILPFIAGADLSSSQYLLVKSDGTDSERVIVATAASDNQIVGVLDNAPGDEGIADVVLSGICKVRAGGALEPHDYIMWGTGGKAVKYVAGSGNICLGRYIPEVADAGGSKSYRDAAATDLVTIDLQVGLQVADVKTTAELASTAGAGLIGILDTATDYTATTVEGALAEVKIIADAAAPKASIRRAVGTAGADAGNSMPVAVQIEDGNGASVAAVTTVLCEIFDADMILGLAAAWTLAETGVGAEVTASAHATLLITTDANGAATVTVSDVVTGTNETVRLKMTVIPGEGEIGQPTFTVCDFN